MHAYDLTLQAAVLVHEFHVDVVALDFDAAVNFLPFIRFIDSL